MPRRNPLPPVQDPPETEFRWQVITTLRRLGYLATAIRRSDGVTIGDSGLPDVICAHPRTGATGAFELKVRGRKATDEQVAWLKALSGGDPPWGPEDGLSLAMVVRPEDWPDVARLMAALAGFDVHGVTLEDLRAKVADR